MRSFFIPIKHKTRGYGVVNLKHYVCKPHFPLPLPYNDQITSCSTANRAQYLCSKEALKGIVRSQAKHCKKTCEIKEYKLEEASNANSLKLNNGTIAVGLRFDTPPSRYSRLMLPYKTVDTEYLVMTWISLVGAVGGTLGMFVGFSIIGTSEWFMANVWKCLKKVSRKRSEIHQT